MTPTEEQPLRSMICAYVINSEPMNYSSLGTQLTLSIKDKFTFANNSMFNFQILMSFAITLCNQHLLQNDTLKQKN